MQYSRPIYVTNSHLEAKTDILHGATHDDLMAVQNPAYMCLFVENNKLTGRLESLT
jgi:hypothetical protein